MDDINGKIDGIVFSNLSTGFYILKVRPDGQTKNIIVKGNFPGIPIGVGIKANFRGSWINHTTYGKQFQSNFTREWNIVFRYPNR